MTGSPTWKIDCFIKLFYISRTIRSVDVGENMTIKGERRMNIANIFPYLYVVSFFQNNILYKKGIGPFVRCGK